MVTWAQAFNNVLPLLGVIIGGVVTYKTQSIILKRQLESDRRKGKEKNNIERLQVYSEILKLEGEHVMYEYTGRRAEFNINDFAKYFRPVLFSKFYLLHQEVANIVRKMDSVIAQANFEEELTEPNNDLLLNHFNELISYLEECLKDYRGNF